MDAKRYVVVCATCIAILLLLFFLKKWKSGTWTKYANESEESKPSAKLGNA